MQSRPSCAKIMENTDKAPPNMSHLLNRSYEKMLEDNRDSSQTAQQARDGFSLRRDAGTRVIHWISPASPAVTHSVHG